MTKDPTERMAICQTCPYLKKPLNRCEKCGCFMDLKVILSGSRCPIGKW